MARIIKLKKKKPTDEGTVTASYGGTNKEPNTSGKPVGLSSETIYSNNLKKKYVDTFGQQPVKPGNKWDETDRGNTSTHMTDQEIEESLKSEKKGKSKKKK